MKAYPSHYNEWLILISIVSDQLLICKFAVFTLFLQMAHVTCIVCLLAVCQDPIPAILFRLGAYDWEPCYSDTRWSPITMWLLTRGDQEMEVPLC